MPLWRQALEALEAQNLQPSKIVVIDSSSVDEGPAIAREHGMIVETMDEASFNHGGTRRYAVEKYCSDCDIAVLLTQDSVLADRDALDRIIAPFDDHEVGAVYGRQLPRRGADPIEAHSRYFNYPSQSLRKSIADATEYGIKAAFFSNAWGAYRVSALNAVGGFPRSAICSEDHYVAAKMLSAGFDIVYAADALAWHSHDLTIAKEFRRYFDVGVFHTQEPWLRDEFGTACSEGRKYVRSELAYLLEHAPLSIPEALLRSLSKLAAYKLGRHYDRLPLSAVRLFSAHRNFWLSDEITTDTTPRPGTGPLS